ncbi:MAG: hypothetical protein NZM25_10075 [Leptospiraceae bacterium]|nr:hypothetical protein [Leptospiraceae bacterium]MDW8307496.1 hypothetical protein [Leptospiraceae bacterium]
MKWRYIALFFFFSSVLAAEKVSKAQVKVEIEDAEKNIRVVTERKDLAEYIPFQEYFFCRNYLALAQNFYENGEYAKASFYATLASIYSQTALYKAERRKIQKEMLDRERDYYKKKVESDTTWVSIALLEAGLKRKGENRFSGSYTAINAFVLPGNKEVAKADQIGPLTDNFKRSLDKIHSVMRKQPDAKLNILTRSQKDTKTSTAISEYYAKAIADYLLEKGGIKSEQVIQEPKGPGKKDGEIELNLSDVSAK